MTIERSRTDGLTGEPVDGGISKAPEAFVGLLRGENFGKLQVRVGPEPTGFPKA